MHVSGREIIDPSRFMEVQEVDNMRADPAGVNAGQVPDLAVLMAEAPPEVLGRTVLAVAAMHEPDGRGRCRWCRPRRRRWWPGARRSPDAACRTRRVIVAELRTGTGPRWVPA